MAAHPILITRRAFVRTVTIAVGAAPLVAACGGAASPTAAPAKQPAPAATTAPPAAATKPAAGGAPAVAATKPVAAATTAPASAATKPAAATTPAAQLPTPVPGKTNIRFFTGEDDPPQIKVYNDLIAEYEKKNPKVKVSVAPAPDDALQKLTASIAAKTAPEFSTLVEAEIMELAVRGFLQPVDRIVDEIGKDDFKPNSLYRIKGKVYNAPYAGGGYGQIWYRDSWLKEAGVKPPTTWDEWTTAAQTLTKNGRFGFTTPGAKGGALNVLFSQLMWSSGATYFDEKLNVSMEEKSKEGIKQTLDFYKELTQFSPPGWPEYSWDGMIDSFLAQKSAMIFYAGRPLSRAEKNAPEVEKDMRNVRLPKSRAGYTAHYDHYDSYAAFTKAVGSSDPEASLDFIKFLIAGDSAIQFLHTVPGHLSPPLYSIEKNPKLWENALMQRHKEDVQNVFRPGGLYYLTEAGAKPGPQGQMETAGIFNLYAGPANARSVPSEMVQRFALKKESADAAIKWGAGEFKRMSDDLKKRIKPAEFGYAG